MGVGRAGSQAREGSVRTSALCSARLDGLPCRFWLPCTQHRLLALSIRLATLLALSLSSLLLQSYVEDTGAQEAAFRELAAADAAAADAIAQRTARLRQLQETLAQVGGRPSRGGLLSAVLMHSRVLLLAWVAWKAAHKGSTVHTPTLPPAPPAVARPCGDPLQRVAAAQRGTGPREGDCAGAPHGAQGGAGSLPPHPGGAPQADVCDLVSVGWRGCRGMGGGIVAGGKGRVHPLQRHPWQVP